MECINSLYGQNADFNYVKIYLCTNYYQDMALTAHLLIALKLKKARSYTSFPPIHAFMACHRLNFTITFYIYYSAGI
jgi:hypothetical protein